MANFVDRLWMLKRLGSVINLFLLFLTIYIACTSIGMVYVFAGMGWTMPSVILFACTLLAGMALGYMMQYVLDLYHRSYDVVSEYIEKSLNRQYDAV